MSHTCKKGVQQAYLVQRKNSVIVALFLRNWPCHTFSMKETGLPCAMQGSRYLRHKRPWGRKEKMAEHHTLCLRNWEYGKAACNLSLLLKQEHVLPHVTELRGWKPVQTGRTTSADTWMNCMNLANIHVHAGILEDMSNMELLPNQAGIKPNFLSLSLQYLSSAHFFPLKIPLQHETPSSYSVMEPKERTLFTNTWDNDMMTTPPTSN